MKKRLFSLLVLIIGLVTFFSSCTLDYVYIVNYTTYMKIEGKYVAKVKDNVIIEAPTRESAMIVFNSIIPMKYDCDSMSTKIDFQKVLR